MQKYIAYKVKTQKRFGNFSGVGAGKTLSAILSSQVIDSKMTVIICPNAIVDQWKKSIEATFPDSVVMTTKEYDKKVFYAKREENKHKYLVINYDKFSLVDSGALASELGSQKIDFFILDEIHYAKRRDPIESKRLKRVKRLMNMAKDAYVLGLSATPVINSLEEGKSILELITGKKYDDVSTKPNTNNAVKLYEKLSTISIRQIPQYPVKENLDEVYADVDLTKSGMHAKDLKTPLDFEQLTLPAKLPKILECINGPTIIYTEYVTEIINKISEAVKAEGYSVAEHHGQNHTGQDLFLNKQVDVLVASHPVSTGVNGLQNVCNNIIISALPWTNAQYKQLVGRLLRTGQEKDVIVHIIKANINGIEYDENKWLRILNKRALADCAVDGIIPVKNIVSPQQAVAEARKWLERLERGEISTIQRRDLDVELTPTPISVQTRTGQHYVVLSDLSKYHKVFNNEYSQTTHQRLHQNPEEWRQYHRELNETRKTWAVDPQEEIIKRIKKLSPNLIIGDFGCGEAKIAQTFGIKSLQL
jgi:superfamily II DNA or RNA helicase